MFFILLLLNAGQVAYSVFIHFFDTNSCLKHLETTLIRAVTTKPEQNIKVVIQKIKTTS